MFAAIRKNAALRLGLEFFAALAVGFGIVGVWVDYEARQDERISRTEERESRREERLVRMWDLATDPRPGNSGKIPALEYLTKHGYPLKGIAIPEAFLSGIDLHGADLEGANLRGVDLSRADLSGVNLSEADLSGARLDFSNLSGAVLFESNLSKASLYKANLTDATFVGGNLFKANLAWANFDGAVFTAFTMNDGVTNKMTIGHPDLREASLTGADLSKVKAMSPSTLQKACVNFLRDQPKLSEKLKGVKLGLCPE